MGFIKYSNANLDLIGEDKPDWALTPAETLAKKAKLEEEQSKENYVASEDQEDNKENKT